MLESRTMVPKSYRQSRDYQALLKLLDLLTVSVKSDVDDFSLLLDPMRCPNNVLPYLASYVGYKYDYNESYETNRLIIKYYPLLIRNRGSLAGISLVVSLAINAVGGFFDLEMSNMFSIYFDDQSNTINIYLYYDKYLSKLHDLLKVVKPAGVKIDIIPSEPIKSFDVIQFNDIFDYNKIDYRNSDRYKVSDQHGIGFGQISKDKNG